mgnify:CR=1 FL=1
MSTIHFKTIEQATAKLKEYAGQVFINNYQTKCESKNAQIREFKKGFAIQFGDYGDYLSNV